MHLKTAPDVESELDLSRYLLPCQVEGVLNDARYQYTEKANRIGWTWTMALKDIRKRLMSPGRDCLFTTQNWNGAIEFGRYIKQWLAVYDLGRFCIVNGSEEYITVHKDVDGSGKKVAVQEKVGIWKFDGGGRMILFSSSPEGIQTFEGDVRWDEAEFHERQEEMSVALGTRIQFGYDLHYWSACNGMDTWINQVLLRQVKAKDSGWHFRRITIYDVIDQGIVEKINARAGTNMTRAEFLEDCRRRVITPAAFAERFECERTTSGSAIVAWQVLETAATETITRAHLDDQEIKDLFGPADEDAPRRVVEMTKWMQEHFGEVLKNPAHYRLGFDVAASGKGDLASYWIDKKEGGIYRQTCLLTTRTEDWHFLQSALHWFMDRPGMRGAGDSTGLGKQITWTASKAFSGRFIGVPFSETSKSRMGTRMMTQLQSGERRITKNVEGRRDVVMDVYCVQKKQEGNQIAFKSTANSLNAASHGDMAWSAMLTPEIDCAAEETPVTITLI